MLDGRKIEKGDAILGLSSNGLHTNGYSLARRVLFKKMRLNSNSRLPELQRPLGEELLRVHRNYQPLLAKMHNGLLHGLAHITGGGLIDNIPRVLPKDCDAQIETGSWQVPPIFRLLEKHGRIERTEMYQVFNMGIGMVAIVSENDAKNAMKMLKARRIGTIVAGTGKTKLVW
jgi:phosphoribosylformylglycinamidine cyclo-ligase